ncbi:anthranilate phosphoribosyltransferase [Aneurinibacillus migulanus]|uniref:Anthranilate phosphoribosyltransferase n=1 Tax=Aneurinibacillus migulanus TaxID=47500 RepID=A0A0D1XHY3_ANEMI|nr:anthranilate phosphoribosyltransferase [Aneurinibacillus migulanus]KIV51868.1 anthranilate phosphoribosyltransferase [Aneurinibacillus migulanus]KON97989.1 anthranilate phosphoribosyltransferase [Aneurinibacillus migulanus]MED0891249.1 anthranilate phosphoribosyltransferase [Aneurinibacillus migulanus]MED1614063.1 anthranilate phosphoribosyltransferase [Aneurinibacillus migulanus]SDI00632.1 anthranilate phosphoribosyltransferase [Aneurinibacillus migulanus]
MFKQLLGQVAHGESLTRDEAREAMRLIMEGEAQPIQIAGFLTALRMKGETVDEIVGFVETMREKAIRLDICGEGLLDTCGTGGDGGGTFNISTAAALVAAAGGVRVAKHGNRAVSSKSGSADVLEALGVTITSTPEAATRCLTETNLCFMFAPQYHQAMKHAVEPRHQLGFRTVFNLLGPLTNPARADRQLLGIYDKNLGLKVAEVLNEMGVKRALVVAGADGLDEISISEPTYIVEVNHGMISSYTVHPEMFGLDSYPLAEVAGGDARVNAEIIQRVLDGEKGAYRDIVVLNAAAAFYLGNKASSIAEGVRLVQELLDMGEGKQKLEQLVEVTGGVSHAS